ncbi:MAG: ImmA/IrrE family metallo-endopeptidase [Burkholderiaceae bacterium]|nr:MAG: ImmA/IrrE family metallo-endopeptidase [Burkholderiaceae bacterium]
MPNSKAIYQTVAGLGLSRAQVRRLLPSWWEPAMEEQADGVIELAMHISRRLSLELSSLMAGHLVPKGAVANIAYKHRADADAGRLVAASYIASSLAQAITAALPTPFAELPADAASFRALAKKINGGGFLNFDALLQLCWTHGIPVIPLPHLPVGVQKMDGAALALQDRPAIVLAKRKSSKAWLSFILAHEIGHIVLGHITPGTTIIDVSLQDASTYATDTDADRQEAEADQFAMAVLGGPEADQLIQSWNSRLSPVEMAVEARTASIKIDADPAHLILRYAFRTRRWAEAAMALGFIQEDVDPQGALVSHLAEHLDLDRVAPDLQDLVGQVTGLQVT